MTRIKLDNNVGVLLRGDAGRSPKVHVMWMDRFIWEGQKQIYLRKIFKGMIGEKKVSAFRPRHAYQMRDLIIEGAAKGSSEVYAGNVIENLKHLFSKAIEWGVIDDHPMIDGNFKMFPKPKTSQINRSDSIDQVLDVLPWVVE